MVLLEDLNGLVGEDPPSAAFCFLGVIPSFSFKAGERMEANVENIFNILSLGYLTGQNRTKNQIWSKRSTRLMRCQKIREEVLPYFLCKNDKFIMTFYDEQIFLINEILRDIIPSSTSQFTAVFS